MKGEYEGQFAAQGFTEGQDRISRRLAMARPRAPRLPLPPHVHSTCMRGREYFSFYPHRGTKRAGKRVPLPGCPELPDGMPNPKWWRAYHEAASAAGFLNASAGPHPGTVGAAVAGYMDSPEWRALKPRVAAELARHLRRLNSHWRDLPLGGIEPVHIVKLRDFRESTPADANNLVGTVSALMSWSVLRGQRSSNPCRDVPKLKIGEGYDPWLWNDIVHFRQHARRDLEEAAVLALYTGQRQSDVLSMSWRDYSDGCIFVKQSKTRKKLRIPIHRDLRAVLERIQGRTGCSIAELQLSNAPMLRNSRDEPWKTGFKASWQAERNRPVMSVLKDRKLVFHGLRKSAVVFLLEAGATTAEVQAITGQSMQMVEHYAKQVNQQKLAAAAILKWEAADEGRTENAADTEFVQRPTNLVQQGTE